jgi:hypothetical protein
MMIFYDMFSEVAYCDETYGSAVTPAGRIQYEEKYTLTCTRRNGRQLVLQRLCGYDKDTRTYKTYGDLLACPGIYCPMFRTFNS